MSFPDDIQHVFDLLVKLHEDHGISYMSLQTSRSGDGPPFFKCVEISTHVGELNLKGSGSENVVDRNGIADAAREAVRKCLKGVEGSYEQNLETLKTAEKRIAGCKRREKKLRAMIPSPLIELAKCAGEESEILHESA